MIVRRPILMKGDEIRTLQQASGDANMSVSTVKRICKKYGIYRQRGPNSKFEVSAVALQMVLHGDMVALEALREGRRSDPSVTPYFDLLGLPT